MVYIFKKYEDILHQLSICFGITFYLSFILQPKFRVPKKREYSLTYGAIFILSSIQTFRSFVFIVIQKACYYDKPVYNRAK
ncbi:hypothetical protein Aconfl_18110 [Algoriphagus confluentis]|uniref:Uncharacterized protein n=1 Tax=Algoriphagus confluentis TaxID=1697556 RepID=A0ABQ6PPP9_9BACT|nr:hypothetical protein Aconfl_18110 [Algoriphagus confluentis]